MTFTLRKPESEKRYQDWKKKNDKNYCPFCNLDLLRKEFKHFIILENRFEYDGLEPKIHHLLATKRHISSKEEMTQEELQELDSIEWQIENDQFDYDSIQKNVKRKMSIPTHWHKHLIKY